MEEENRKRGAQPGNRNARTHGFYSKKLDETEKAEHRLALEIEGLDYEIALMRVKLQSIIEHDPANIKLITQATNALTRLLTAQHTISQNDGKSKQAALENIRNNVISSINIDVEAILKGLRK
jgi:uncharacterized protein YjcR